MKKSIAWHILIITVKQTKNKGFILGPKLGLMKYKLEDEEKKTVQ